MPAGGSPVSASPDARQRRERRARGRSGGRRRVSAARSHGAAPAAERALPGIRGAPPPLSLTVARRAPRGLENLLWFFWLFRGGQNMRIRFGECTFDAVRREVRRGAESRPPLAQGLRAAATSRREPAARARRRRSCFERSGRTSFVTEASLAGLVVGDPPRDRRRRARAALPAHGARIRLRLCGRSAAAADEDGVFRLVWGLREVPLGEGENLLGRDPDARRSRSTTPRSPATTPGS